MCIFRFYAFFKHSCSWFEGLVWWLLVVHQLGGDRWWCDACMFLSFCGASSAVGFTIVLEGWLFLGACVFYSSNMNDQHCIILNWNARGLSNPARRQVVRDSVKETKAF
jgi:hypothetical protein